MYKALVIVGYFLLITNYCYSQKSALSKLDYFTQIPKEIDGCTGLYTSDSISMKDKKYLIVTNLQDFAQIKIAGKRINLKLESQKQLSKNSYQSIYIGSGYKVVLTTKTIKQIDELSEEKGTLEISNKESKRTITIHGKSGC